MNKRVLIVAETNEELAEVARYLMERGCSVEVEARLAEALSWFRLDTFDVVLLDLDLPNLRPQDFLAARQAVPHAVRFVVATSEERPLALCHAAECGVAGYMSKPLDKEWLYRQVMEA